MDSHYPFAVHSLDKIKATVDALDPDDARPLVVLVSTGAYCPVHKYLDLLPKSNLLKNAHPHVRNRQGLLRENLRI